MGFCLRKDPPKQAVEVAAACPDHGDVELKFKDVQVVIDQAEILKDSYRFFCPRGREIVITSPRNQTLISALIERDVEIVDINTSSILDRDALNQQYEISAEFGPIADDESIDLGLMNEDAFTKQIFQEFGVK